MKKKDDDYRINARVQYLMQIEGLNANSLAQKLGYTNNGVIYDIVKGRLVKDSSERKKTRPGRKLLEKISSVFGVRYEWLIDGEGPVYEAQVYEAQDRNLVKLDVRLIELPYIDFYAAASFKVNSGDGVEYAGLKKKKIIRLHEDVFYENTILIRVIGDSMEPTISDDALLLARVIDKANWKYINNAVYAVFYGNSYEIKRVLENEIIEKGYLTLVADNPTHGKHRVNAEDIHQILKIEEIVQSKVY